MRTRAEYEAQVAGPGKFESEPAYTPYFYDLMLDGGGDDTLTDPDSGAMVDVFIVTPSDAVFFDSSDDLDVEDSPLRGVHAVLLWEDEQGFVYAKCVSERELDEYRDACEAQGDDDDEQDESDEPGEEDYYLSDDEQSIYYCGKRIVEPASVTDCRNCDRGDDEHCDCGRAECPICCDDACSDYQPYACDRDAAMAALREYMRTNEYWPNVWAISDHGNPTLISVLDCGCYFTEHEGDASRHPAEVQS